MSSTASSSSSWAESNGVLRRRFEFGDFVEAFAFVTQVALIAQRQNHHPDISISWSTVDVATTSHDAGNTITDRDHALTAAIDALG